MIKNLSIFLFVLVPLIYAEGLGHRTTLVISNEDSVSNHYSNPVFNRPIADPTVLFDKDSKIFYAYGTSDSWADKKGIRWVPIIESTDLVNWKYKGNAFTNDSKPNWKEGGIWAPDIVKVSEKYHLYYSISIWHDKDPSIGVAVADSPLGPFIDKGKIISTLEIGVPNSIDPFYFEDNGKKYLFWGSFDSSKAQGTYGVELTSDGLSIKDPSKKIKIAAGDWEAVVIHKKGDFYYMFGSKGTCCEGANSKYHVLVGRSSSLFGPYLDRNGKDIAERGNGTLVLKGNKTIVGPGHNSRIFTDTQGNDYVFYHGIEPEFPVLKNGVNRRLLCVDQVHWQNGWPIINNGSPSSLINIKPKF